VADFVPERPIEVTGRDAEIAADIDDDSADGRRRIWAAISSSVGRRARRGSSQNTRMFRSSPRFSPLIASEAKQSSGQLGTTIEIAASLRSRNDRTTRTIADVSAGY
jgi:hypothetical protein